MEIKISQKNNGCLSMLDCKDNEYTILVTPDDLEGLKASGLCIGAIVTAMDCAVWTNDGVSFWLRGSANEGDFNTNPKITIQSKGFTTKDIIPPSHIAAGSVSTGTLVPITAVFVGDVYPIT